MPPDRRPTAVTAAIDLLAFGVLQALLQHGIRVPEEVSLVGYDDIPFARQLSVPLTTVRRPHYAMGTTAAQMLTSVLSGEAPAAAPRGVPTGAGGARVHSRTSPLPADRAAQRSSVGASVPGLAAGSRASTRG